MKASPKNWLLRSSATCLIFTNQKVLICFLIFWLCNNGYSQNIYTLAGNGTVGYSGDGGPANLAQMKYPYSLAIDASGNLFISDVNNHCIRKITPSGIISTFAGTGSMGFSGDGSSANLAQLSYPAGISFDTSGNLYIIDRGNGRVRKVSISGIISTIAGTNTIGYTGDGGLAINATFNGPSDIATDVSGNIYITDYFNHVVRKINTSGIITTFAGTGTQGYAGDGSQANLALLNGPKGIVTDASGNVYFSEQTNHVIRKVNTSGVISTIAGIGTGGFSGDGGQANLAKINSSDGMDIDATGNLYIADLGNHRVRKVNSLGVISTIAGTGVLGFSGDGGLAINAQLFGLSDIVMDATGNIYICDLDNNRIRAICPGSCFAGIDESNNSDNQLKIYPNPTSNILNIKTEQSFGDGTQIEITNTLGQVVLKTGFINEIGISALSDGVYFLQIENSKGQIFQKKLIVSR